MKRLIFVIILVSLQACGPANNSHWQMTTRLNYNDYPVNWQAELVRGCDTCEIKKERLYEPDGVTELSTIYQQGQWRAQNRKAHKARLVFEMGAQFLLVRSREDGLIQLENKHADIKIITKLEQPFEVTMGRSRYEAVITKFEEPRADFALSEPLSVKLHYSVLKSQ